MAFRRLEAILEIRENNIICEIPQYSFYLFVVKYIIWQYYCHVYLCEYSETR